MGNCVKCKRCETPMKKGVVGFCDICLREIAEMGLSVPEYLKMREGREAARQNDTNNAFKATQE